MANLASLPLLTTGSNVTLPIETWLPYELDTNFAYYGTYIQQILSILVVGTSATGSTLMISGFMYQICAQFEILKYRFSMLPEDVIKYRTDEKSLDMIYKFEKNILKFNVQHHLYILEYEYF